MADTPRRARLSLGTAAASIYIPPTVANTYGILRTLQACNETALAANFTVGITIGGAAAADAAGNRLFFQAPIGANAIIEWTGFMPLYGLAANPDILYGLCSVAAAVTITAGIIEIT